MKKIVLKKTIVCGIIILMIGVGASSVIGITHEKQESTGQEAIIYHFHGLRYTKTTLNIPASTVGALQEEYHKIKDKQLNTYAEIMQKQDVLRKYGLLTAPQNLKTYYPESSVVSRILQLLQTPADQGNQGRFLLLGILGSINGEFYGRTIDFLNLRFLGLPLIIFGAGGCELRLVDLFYLGQPQYLSTDAGYLYCSLFFVGQITITPFLDPDGGQITGFTVGTLALGGQ